MKRFLCLSGIVLTSFIGFCKDSDLEKVRRHRKLEIESRIEHSSK